MYISHNINITIRHCIDITKSLTEDIYGNCDKNNLNCTSSSNATEFFKNVTLPQPNNTKSEVSEDDG